MPLPKDPSTLYDLEPEEYFQHHHMDEKLRNAAGLLGALERKTCGRKLLDVGCGQGALLVAARRRGWEAVGLDVSERFARSARNELKLPVLIGDISSIDMAPESFDVVVLNAILEHLPDPRRSLLKVQSVLRPGGVVWIDVPNERGLYYRTGNLWNRLCGRDWVVNLSPTFSPGHLYGFSRRSLEMLLRRSGFPRISIAVYQGVNCLPPPQNVRESFVRRAVDITMLAARLLSLGDGITAMASKPGCSNEEPTATVCILEP